MDKKTILLLFGGESSEHDVSVASATNVFHAINHDAYNVQLGFIGRDGKWWLLEKFEQYQQTNTAQEVSFELGKNEIIAGDVALRIDAILPILHGKNGEDGSVQGLAQLLHVPIVGCDVTASSICMDKVATKEIAAMNDIAITPYFVYRNGEERPNFQTITKNLDLPLFVKPSRAGSSVGVSKVRNEREFYEALDTALLHDKTVLVEKAMNIREIEVAVLGTPPHHKASTPGEVKPGEEFYSYDDKYAASSTSSVEIPAQLDGDVAQTISRMAEKIFAIIGCSGLARVDFFLADDGTVYLNEINTLPGFTDISMYPKMWQHDGILYSDLIDKLIADAVE